MQPIKFARFGPQSVPPGGACVSSFVLIRRNGEVMLCKIRDPDLWDEEFSINRARPDTWIDKWRLPATHLRFGEHPEEAARRVIEKQLGIRDYRITLIQVQSHIGESSVYRGETHWDICFVYEAEVKEEVRPNKYISEIKYMDAEKIGPDDLGSGHGWVIAELKNPKGRIR